MTPDSAGRKAFSVHALHLSCLMGYLERPATAQGGLGRVIPYHLYFCHGSRIFANSFEQGKESQPLQPPYL
jgi:hypothetical protein